MSLAKIIAAFVIASLPRSTEDWAVGDLAICIDAKWPMTDDIAPKEGDLLRVEHICMGGLFLHFHGKPADRHWLAAHFRKVRPDTQPAADDAWVEQLRHLRRKEAA